MLSNIKLTRLREHAHTDRVRQTKTGWSNRHVNATSYLHCETKRRFPNIM